VLGVVEVQPVTDGAGRYAESAAHVSVSGPGAEQADCVMAQVIPVCGHTATVCGGTSLPDDNAERSLEWGF
jgi:hypothetical protein